MEKFNLKDFLLENSDRGHKIFQYFIHNLPSKGSRKNIPAIFRKDGKHSDANVYYNEKMKTWIYHDFVTGENLSPFDFIMKLKNCDFTEALNIVGNEIVRLEIPKSDLHAVKPVNKMKFEFLENENFTYWYDFIEPSYVTEAVKKYKIKSLSEYRIEKDGKVFKTFSTEEEPIFAFTISESCFKIYRPKNTKGNKFFWLGAKPNDYHDVFGLQQLPEKCDFILITEGLKDAFVANSNGLYAVGVDNVNIQLHAESIVELKKRTDFIIVCYDIDEIGIKKSKEVASQHGLYRLELPESLKTKGGKDIADYFRLKMSKPELLQSISELIAKPPVYSEPVNLPPKVEQKKESRFAKVEELLNSVYEIQYNVVTNALEYRQKNEPCCEFKSLNINNIYRFLQHNNVEFSLNKLSALVNSDFVKVKNPFTDYFESLGEVQSGEPDYIAQLCTYVKVKDQDRFNLMFKKALVRCVACSIKDEVINKQAIIIVHDEQNSGKSTFIRWLCPPALKEYIAENISTDKDSLISLGENFIINMDEMATMSKVEINSLKSFLSKEKIKLRRPFDKSTSLAPRRANFFGSTNKLEFLTDETGSVRWLCFELVEKLNFNYNKDIDINNIWKQAYSLFKSGYKYELTLDEISENERANLLFQVSTPEMELIQKEFEPGTKEDHTHFFTATDILTMLSEKFKNIKLAPTNVGKALKLLGFEKISKRVDQFPIKGYYIKFKSI